MREIDFCLFVNVGQLRNFAVFTQIFRALRHKNLNAKQRDKNYYC